MRALVATGMARGLSPERCLGPTGIVPADLTDADLVVEAGQELQVIRNLISALGDLPGLGVDAGRRLNFGSHGIWGYAVLTSPTWADALRLGARFATLTYAFALPEVHPRQPRIDFATDEIPEDVREFLTERDLTTCIVLFALRGSGTKVRLDTRLPEQRAAAVAAVNPRVLVRGGQPGDYFTFDPEAWHQRLPQADTDALRSCERECMALLERRSTRRGTAARVRARLLERPEVKPTMAMVAADLHMEVRTLRRHLTAEGTSFQALLDEVHQTLAGELLGMALSVDEVAHRLGYADGPTFTHAFKRWTGITPSAWRAGGVDA